MALADGTTALCDLLQALEPQAAAKTDGMADEYGTMNSDGETVVLKNFQLESGAQLPEAETRFKTWGQMNELRDNVIVVCHALTGNANLEAWWGALLGPGKPLDTSKYFVFCANVLGGCYGSSGPSSINPDTARRYGGDFPAITIRDMVNLQVEVLSTLQVLGVACVVGGSMGGMQALEWAMLHHALQPRAVVSLSASGRHQPWQIGIGECQRQAIRSDPLWKGGHYSPNEPPTSGVAVARMMAMVMYRSHPGYWTKFGRSVATTEHEKQVFDVENYLHYQGNRFNERGFDANTYITLTRAMDSHDLSRERGDYFEVLGSVTLPVLIVSISSDVLYPYAEQLELAKHMPNSQHHMIQSDEGHDGFLLEERKVGILVRGFLAELECNGRPAFAPKGGA